MQLILWHDPLRIQHQLSNQEDYTLLQSTINNFQSEIFVLIESNSIYCLPFPIMFFYFQKKVLQTKNSKKSWGLRLFKKIFFLQQK
jgi:hypothetical protein